MANDGAPGAPPPATPGNFGQLISHNLSQASRGAPAPTPATPQAPPQATEQPGGQNGQSERAQAFGTYEEGQGLRRPGQPEQPNDSPEQALEGQEAAEQEAADLIHGLAPEAILEALRGGKLPTELMQALKGVAKIDGQEHEVTLDEAIQGYQRRSDYTRGKQEAAKIKEQAETMRGNIRTMFDTWRQKPDQMIEDVERLNLTESFEKAVEQIARERYEDLMLKRENPAAYEARMENRRLAKELKAMQRQQPRQADPRQQQATAMAERIEPLMPDALKAVGLRNNAISQKYFGEALAAIITPDGDIEAMVAEAAKTAREMVDDDVRQYREGQQQVTAQPKPPPAKGAPGPAGKAVRQQRMHPGQMAAFLEQRKPRR